MTTKAAAPLKKKVAEMKRPALTISTESVKLAGEIKQRYKTGQPLCLPGEEDRILMPEFLLNEQVGLSGLEDPLPLAMMATRDPENPMALAAAARLGPQGKDTKLVNGVLQLVGETSRHPGVKKCVDLITDSAFNPGAIAAVRRHASHMIIQTRKQYSTALRQNLQALLEGVIAPRQFVREFFELTEAGNLRHDVRRKLVASLLLSPTIRPGIKFLFLENFDRLSTATRCHVISEVLRVKDAPHVEIIKEELKWIVQQGQLDD
ncbi:hypothetical protein [Magnetospira sp. QH-2]|uniref:hypothetical protein n=1 Tax=Magnetospira sp. (strain QH-2) TaxID=1288970 RepID=UPI0003E815FF|nr:hypothetical protein [Magnetospira sp. QH-2]CCQ74153.1 Protein of unknown function [Magnetospira sp. QH-2]